MKPAQQQTIKTRRLLLRSIAVQDAPRIAELAGDWEVARMTGRVPYPYDEQRALHWLNDLADGEIVYGIEYNGEMIGMCGYTLATDRSAEVGYWIGRPYWGRGFATEAARAVMRFGFERAGVLKFRCSHFTDNTSSRRVIEKLGFRELGAGQGWCEARQIELPTILYEQKRPWLAKIRALAS